MTKAEFYSLTMRQWVALKNRLREQRRRRDDTTEYMLAQLTAITGNGAFRAFTSPAKTEDFMPSLWLAAAQALPVPVADKIRSMMELSMAKGTVKSGA